MPIASRPARSIARWAMALSCLSTLAGCGLMVVGGTAATTTLVATDRRTTGQQVDDQTIEMKVSSEMGNAFGDKARVLGTAYAGRLLLVGDVPTEADRAQAEKIATAIPQVTQVDNYIRVGDITPLSVRTNDTWLTSKVKSKLISTDDVPFRTIKVTTERGVVYLMGKVTADESTRAGIAAASITGVNKVVKLFEIVARETLLVDPSGDNASTSKTSSGASDSTSGTTNGDSGTQAIPVQ